MEHKGDGTGVGSLHRAAVPREEPDGVSESVYGPAGAHHERAVATEEHNEGAAVALLPPTPHRLPGSEATPLTVDGNGRREYYFPSRKTALLHHEPSTKAAERPQVIDVDEEGWDALDEIHGTVGKSSRQNTSRSRKVDKPFWVPQGMDPVLEELPKWTLLADILKEIEGEIIRQESLPPPLSRPLAGILSDFLSDMDAEAPPGTQGRKMMIRKLYSYLAWKGKLNSQQRNDGRGSGSAFAATTFERQNSTALSEALKKKDREKADGGRKETRAWWCAVEYYCELVHAEGIRRTNPHRRGRSRRFEYGSGQLRRINATATAVESATVVDADDLDFTSTELLVDFDTNYGLLTPEETVVVRPYSDDGDDSILAEMRPKFIVMFEPNMDFIRRVEVYKSSNPGLAVRVYHMVYGDSCEEHKYLVGIRKEKESFERLIKERAVDNVAAYTRSQGPRKTSNDALLKTISSRIAGGRREISTTPSQIVSDMKSYVKPTAKYPQKKGGGIEGNQAVTSLQSKIVLLLLHFPRVRIIWASSPYATVEIFQELKQANPEPIPSKPYLWERERRRARCRH
ncbi:DNA repair protein [Salix suchowensis]|nr:DNA repair protein [Salix suchowensis]